MRKKRQAAATAAWCVAVGIAFALFVGGVASTLSAARANSDLFPDLKVGFNIRW